MFCFYKKLLCLSFIFYKYYSKKFSKSQFIGTFRNVRKTLKTDLHIFNMLEKLLSLRPYFMALWSLFSYPIVRLSLPIN